MTTEKNNSKNKIICIALFAVYAVLTLIGAVNHEIWFDEAQAWTIARDNDITGIYEQLRYEGHPPLWYMILFVFSRLGFSCNVMPLISWFFTAIAAAVVMFKSPFSTVTKSLLIFSGGFLFFNSVMSRTYCLINLFLVLIAMLFQKRKEHPVIFGLLVALLANTHVFVSGFIGAMGLIMLHDIYTDWKTNTVKKNALNLTGLAIAGIGVLMLIIPLIGSLSVNKMTSAKDFSLKYCLTSFGESFFNISKFLIGGYVYSPYLLAGVFSILFVILLLLMRHKTRPMLILGLSCLFYIIVTEIIWFTIPNRVHILLLIYFVTMWIAENEPENKASSIWSKFNPKTDTKIVQKLLNLIKNTDLNFNKSYKALLSVLLIVSIPVGAVYLGLDYIKEFSPGKAAAELICERLPVGSVLVTTGDPVPEMSAYLPEYRIYSMAEHDFTSYDLFIKYDETIDYGEKIYNDLKSCENVYMLTVMPDINAIESNRDIILSVREYIPFGTNFAYVEVSELDVEKEIKP